MTLNIKTTNSNRVYDGHHNLRPNYGRKTTPISVRIYVDQYDFITKHPDFTGNASTLFKILLDRFINDPADQAAFKAYLENERKFTQEAIAKQEELHNEIVEK